MRLKPSWLGALRIPRLPDVLELDAVGEDAAEHETRLTLLQA